MTLFDFGFRWHLSWSRVVSDEDHDLIVGRWLNGRLFGCYVSLMVPALRTTRLKRPTR